MLVSVTLEPAIHTQWRGGRANTTKARYSLNQAPSNFSSWTKRWYLQRYFPAIKMSRTHREPAGSSSLPHAFILRVRSKYSTLWLCLTFLNPWMFQRKTPRASQPGLFRRYWLFNVYSVYIHIRWHIVKAIDNALHWHTFLNLPLICVSLKTVISKGWCHTAVALKHTLQCVSLHSQILNPWRALAVGGTG